MRTVTHIIEIGHNLFWVLLLPSSLSIAAMISLGSSQWAYNLNKYRTLSVKLFKIISNFDILSMVSLSRLTACALQILTLIWRHHQRVLTCCYRIQKWNLTLYLSNG